jgi:tetratricopeptide (TPR) repeat protein
MGIRRKENCKGVLLCATILAIIFAGGRASRANNRTATEALLATYDSGATLTPAEAKRAISNLESALVDCGDTHLAFRVRYRIGVMSFKAHMMDAAKAQFLQTARERECPEMVRMCSLNMAGQISRLQAGSIEALEIFERVANLAEQHLSNGTEHGPESAYTRLTCSALLGRAEIYELRRDYAASIKEYDRILDVLRRVEGDHASNRAASLKDRISQLCIRQGHVNEYLKRAETLTKEHPDYCRTALIKLETECVRFIKDCPESPDFVSGSFSAPAQAVALVRSSPGEASAQEICAKVRSLCKEHTHTYAGLLLQYHYAWFLDAAGRKDEAARALGQVFTSDAAAESKSPSEKAVVQTLEDYAKIQYAIIAAEKTDYVEALRVLAGLQMYQDRPHISELARSIYKGVEILRREVPKNEERSK